MSKFISMIVAIMMISCSVIPVFALEDTEGVVPVGVSSGRYQVLRIVTTSVAIDSNMATCKSSANTSSDGYTINITMRLQKKSGTSWINVETWTGSGTGTIGAKLTKTKSSLSAGTYRTAIYVTVYDSAGSFVESTMLCSNNAIC